MSRTIQECDAEVLDFCGAHFKKQRRLFSVYVAPTGQLDSCEDEGYFSVNVPFYRDQIESYVMGEGNEAEQWIGIDPIFSSAQFMSMRVPAKDFERVANFFEIELELYQPEAE